MKQQDKPELQDFHINGVKHIKPEDALKEIENNQAVMVDVREKDEVKLEYISIPNIHYYPMSIIMNRMEFLSKDQPIIFICEKGVRSTKTVNLFNRMGYTSAANLDGGLKEWKARNLPCKSVFKSSKNCSNNCNSCRSTNEDRGCF